MELKFRACIKENIIKYFDFKDIASNNLFTNRVLLRPWLSDNNIPDVFTGLKDNTKWVDLSIKEKEKFINSIHKALDKNEISKYISNEKIPPEWKGKDIYSGDIVEFTMLGSLHESSSRVQGEVKFIDGIFCLEYDKEKGYSDCLCNCLDESKVIGNVHMVDVTNG